MKRPAHRRETLGRALFVLQLSSAIRRLIATLQSPFLENTGFKPRAIDIDHFSLYYLLYTELFGEDQYRVLSNTVMM
jgi:hypothetical protein